MLDFFIDPFTAFDFMRRALMGSLLLCVGATPVGVFLTLRRMSLTGDAMAHAILPGAAIGFMMAGLSVMAMTIGGLIAGAIVALLAGVTARKTDTAEDSSLASFYLISLATGVMIISLSGSTVDLMHVLFGSTLALDNTALLLLLTVCAITLISLSIIYRPLVLECVDPNYLKSINRMGEFAHYAFLVLVVLNLVSGFHAMGTLMAVGLMILPATISRFWVYQLESMILLSVTLAFLSCVAGLLVSYYANVPTSPMIIINLGVGYFFSLLFGLRKGLISRLIIQKQKHLAA